MRFDAISVVIQAIEVYSAQEHLSDILYQNVLPHSHMP